MNRSFKTYVFENLCSALTFGRLGSLHAVPNRDQLSIDIFETGPEGISNDSLDLALHKNSRKRPKGFVQEIVFRISDREFKRFHLDLDVMNFEDGRLVLFVRADQDNRSLSKSSKAVYRRIAQRYLREARSLRERHRQGPSRSSWESRSSFENKRQHLVYQPAFDLA